MYALFSTYDEALNWIHARLRLGMKPGLKRMEWMLEKLSHPEQKLQAIHIGGTNGKGSTVTYVRSMLQAAGYEVGTFTSPYIEQFNERISVNGIPIADNDITRLVNIIKPLTDELENTPLGPPTEFEVITAMAIYYFSELHPVDFVIFEVGLGGRFDSTNVITPLLSIITNVGMDHTQILGDTIEQIAFEKAGIIKENTAIFTCIQIDEGIQQVEKIAKEKNAPLFQLGKDFFVSSYQSLQNREQFTLKTYNVLLENIQISLLGKHQTENAAVAIASILYLQESGHVTIHEQHIRDGLLQAYWPGRFEILQVNPTIIMDGAHNPEGMRSFVSAMEARYSHNNIKIVFAALKDKDLTEMFALLNTLKAQIFVTEFDFPRAATAEELKEISNNPNVTADPNSKLLIKQLIESLEKDEVLAIVSSLYFISEMKPFIVNLIRNQECH